MSTSISERDNAVVDIFHENPVSGDQAVKYVSTNEWSAFDRSGAAVRVCPKMTI